MMYVVVIRIPFRKILLSTKPYYNQKEVFDFPIFLWFSGFSDNTITITGSEQRFEYLGKIIFEIRVRCGGLEFYQKFWRWAHYFNTWAGRGPLTSGTVVKVNERLGRLLLREDTKRRRGRVMHEYLLPRERRGPDVAVTGPRRIRKYNLLTGPPPAKYHHGAILAHSRFPLWICRLISPSSRIMKNSCEISSTDAQMLPISQE